MTPRRVTRVLRPLRFMSVYWRAVAGSIYALTFGLGARRHRELLSNIARHFGYDYHQVPPALPRIGVADVVRPGARPDIRELAGGDGNVSLLELVVLAASVARIAAREVFEIGTFDGRTTVNLAANVVDDGTVFTLDLPPAQTPTALGVHAEDRKYIKAAHLTSRISRSEHATRIRPLFGDSATFDFSPYARRIDLCFVDGSHAYEYVLNDSARALEMIRPGGVIFWHDYGVWPGVTEALDELQRSNPAFANLRWIEGTSLAVLGGDMLPADARV